MEINLTVDRFENNSAVLIMKNGQSIIWPKDKLPPGATEGSVIKFNLLDNKGQQESQKKLAQNILNEIFNIGGENTS